jgi:branched-chain amino acid transport system substrate-binding protein
VRSVYRLSPLLALVLASCLGRAPLPIGFIGPLTGHSSAVGVGARNGFLLALGKGPGAAPGKIGETRLLIKDDENDPDKCLEAMRQLKAEGCGLVILATTSQAAAKAIPWGIGQNILILSPTVSNTEFSGRDDLFIRINSSSDSYGVRLADVAFDGYGKRRMGIVGDLGNELYVRSVAGAFGREFRAKGGELLFDLEFHSDRGIPADELLARLKRTGADGLVILTASTEAAMIAKFMEKEEVRTGIFLPPWPLTIDLLNNGGKAVEGAIAVSVSDFEYRSEAGRAFHEGYLATYGEDPSFTAAFGYEASAILRRVLAMGGSPDPEAVKARLIGQRHFVGLQGSIDFDRNGDASRDLLLYAIEDGKFRRIGE